MTASKQIIIAIMLLMSFLPGLTSWVSLRLLPASVEPPSLRFAVVSASEAEPEPPKKEKEEAPLETILRKWAEADEKTQQMHVRFTRTDTNRVYETSTITKGRASIKKPDLWRIDLLEKEGQIRNVFLLVDKRLHLFDAETKTERIFDAPEDPKDDHVKEIQFDPPLPVSIWNCPEQMRWLSFGPQAREMDSRYKLGLSKRNQWYIYLDIEPRGKRRPSGWLERLLELQFERGRIVLDRNTYQVRQVWLEYANQDTVLVDFLERQTNPKETITRESVLEEMLQGWKREELKELGKEKK